jgi:hypothetical protein
MKAPNRRNSDKGRFIADDGRPIRSRFRRDWGVLGMERVEIGSTADSSSLTLFLRFVLPQASPSASFFDCA